MSVTVDMSESKLPDGLQLIKDNTDITVALPWNGHYGMFTIHMLNATQLRACGDFSTLNIQLEDIDDKSDEDTMMHVKEIKNMQERMMRMALVKPSFDEIFDYLNATELVKRMRATIEELKQQIRTVEDVQQAKIYANELEAYELFLGFLFPDDFTEAFISTLVQRDNTDIKRVTEDMLLKAAMLAERGNDNPSDHINGIFTDLQKQDIDTYGWILLNKHREREKMEKDVSKQWVRGRRTKRR